jgi:TPR repeat protein
MQKACDNKMPTACYEFGLLYEDGIGVEKNKDKAKAYYLQACEYGFDIACKKFEAIKIEK